LQCESRIEVNREQWLLYTFCGKLSENGIVRGKAPCHQMLHVYQQVVMNDRNTTEVGIIHVQPQ
jgi:hypothetical protein